MTSLNPLFTVRRRVAGITSQSRKHTARRPAEQSKEEKLIGFSAVKHRIGDQIEIGEQIGSSFKARNTRSYQTHASSRPHGLGHDHNICGAREDNPWGAAGALLIRLPGRASHSSAISQRKVGCDLPSGTEPGSGEVTPLTLRPLRRRRSGWRRCWRSGRHLGALPFVGMCG